MFRSFTWSCWSKRRPFAVLLQMDMRLSDPTEKTRFDPSMFFPVVICVNKEPTIYLEEWVILLVMEKTDFSCSLLAHSLISQQIEFNNQSYENDGIKQ